MLYGTPMDEREEVYYPLSGLNAAHGTICSGEGICDDHGVRRLGWSGYLALDGPGELDRQGYAIEDAVHDGAGELLKALQHLQVAGAAQYNIDGCWWLPPRPSTRPAGARRSSESWSGRTSSPEERCTACTTTREAAGSPCRSAQRPTPLSSTTSSSQAGSQPVRRTRERVLGLSTEPLSEGEDASFTHDGLRISSAAGSPVDWSRRPRASRRPLVDTHDGGPQGQERPTSRRFSMPLIQFPDAARIAVFEPNVRGTTGYGLLHEARRQRLGWTCAPITCTR